MTPLQTHSWDPLRRIASRTDSSISSAAHEQRHHHGRVSLRPRRSSDRAYRCIVGSNQEATNDSMAAMHENVIDGSRFCGSIHTSVKLHDQKDVAAPPEKSLVQVLVVLDQYY